ncbi:MAG: hypothetical protein ACO1OG_01630 [Devosia sp.]
MLKSVRVPHEIIAIEQMQRATIREVGAPLYLPAFQNQILDAEARREDDEGDLHWGIAADFGAAAEDDDDFY